MQIEQNVPLAPLTTLKVGGPARYFVESTSSNEVQQAVAFSRCQNLPVFVLGGGSNLVVSDRGFAGTVLKIKIKGIERDAAANGRVVFDVGAGECWDEFVAKTVHLNCAGVECLSGIPGTVGATPVQNVGAYGQEVSDTIESVQALDLRDDTVRELGHDECRFAYRSSMFNTNARGRFVILRVRYALTPGAAPVIVYADLKKHFARRETAPSLAEVREAVRQIRAVKGMLIQEGDPDSCSAGSFFKNPVISSAQHDELVRRAQSRGLVLPSYPALESHKKISAAWLVENSGFHKGYVLGRAGISSKHALAIINYGAASAAEIVTLKNQIQAAVEKAWGVRLDPEPVFLGF